MSSSQNNKENIRIKSIRRQLASRVIGQKIRVCLSHDILLFLLVMLAWFGACEYLATGTVSFKNNTHTITSENLVDNEDDFLNEKNQKKKKNISEIIDDRNSRFRYVVSNRKTEEILFSIPFYKGMCNIGTIIAGVFVIQIIFGWMSYPAEQARIKKILKPLSKLTERVDELAKYELTEDKYRLIEDEITHIVPEDQKTISLKDEELVGIERAINSLIKRIHESNQQQARFVNDASHELRTPIAVIQGYANMLARWGREDGEVLDESINAILNESENMKHLVEQLLFLARGDAGRTVINKERINLSNIMREVYEESLMIDEGHIYKLSLPEEDVYAIADEGLIKQAIRILVDNAAKYTENKDEILLSTGMRGNDKVYLQVQDSGIGMKEADVEHMFERFYRADEARTFNGTGLGLSIAKWIVDKHEGHFEIISREDLGTRIGIYLTKA